MSDSRVSDTSAKSMLLLALLHRWVSLWGVGESNSVNPKLVDSKASPEEVCIGMAKGWIGLDMKERRLAKFQLEDERNLSVGSSLLSECEKVELPLSGFSEVACKIQ